ncbi:TetR/AcrR family transcriptional regulator [Streptomyces sp. ICBB 8177]|uniref:TetR/AcrR family transcriptional regulator n=1 Tax=Streptomyces sp. ICBB 8177 TaxID=563922 RepID=UPI000D67AE34|nr:TetR/AcrR family transcriptional regulator [Streptomyces sp. ICBB 8177]PWI42996.1 TetR family transcriptional regulator [Streptomyces sp. ICBB 8177]
MTAEARTEATRRLILAAACETIAEAGFEKVRMRMVAEHAGVSTALLHYHFDTREKLFLEALKFSYESAGRAGYDAEPPADAPHAWRLARVIDACLPLDSELRRDFLLWQELHLRAARDKGSLRVARELYAGVTDWVADVVRAGVTAGEFAPCDAERLADLIIALTDGYGARLLMDPTPRETDEVRRRVWSVVAPQIGLDVPFPPADPLPSNASALDPA